jgi:hypothetical protein
MAKDEKKKGKKAKKANPIPKELGGIKVPKKLRKAGKQAVKLVRDPVVSEVVAAALLSAAAALRKGTGDSNASPDRDAAQGVRRQASGLGDSLKGLAIDLARRTLEGVGDRQRATRGGGGAEAADKAEAADESDDGADSPAEPRGAGGAPRTRRGESARDPI